MWFCRRSQHKACLVFGGMIGSKKRTIELQKEQLAHTDSYDGSLHLFDLSSPTHHFTAGSTSKMSWRFLLHPSTKSSCVAQKSEVMSIKTTYQLAQRYKTLTHLGKTSNSMFRCLAWDLREDLEKFQNSFKFNSSKFQTFEWNLQIIASSEGEFYCFTAFEFICSTFFFCWLS